MVHEINTLKFQELMGTLKNTKIKLKAQQQSEKVEVLNERKKGLALKTISMIPHPRKVNLKMMIRRMSILLHEDFSNWGKNSSRRNLNRSRSIEKKKLLSPLVLNATNMDI